VTPGSAAGSSETISAHVDVSSDAFAGRLSTLLREHRRADGIRLRALARRSAGRFTTRDLREIEAGRSAVDDAVELTALYGADLSSILPARMAVEVDPGGRVITAGVAEEFEPDDVTSLLTAYLRLIRRLRNDERAPVVALRRDDVEALAAVIDEPGERVLDRLGELMSVTQAQRKVMVGLFVSGAVVVGLAVTAVAATTGDPSDPVPAAPAGSAVGDEPAGEVDELGVEVDESEGVDVEGVDVETGEVEIGDVEIGDVEGVFLPEPWSVPVAPAAGLDVSPLAPAADEPAPAPAPAPVPAPTPAPAPAPTEPDDVAVGEPPVPVTTAPIVEPAPPPPVDPADDDPEPTVAVAPPPVPSTTAPIPDP
jgi:hypothetical protein